MSQLVKTKRQANFKGFKRFGAFKGLVERSDVRFNVARALKALYTHVVTYATYYPTKLKLMETK
jgi:hypothetical protein